MLIGTEIEYAPTATRAPGAGPIFLSGAIVSAYLGLKPPRDDIEFDGAWVESLNEHDLISAPRVPATVAGVEAGLPSSFLANGGRLYVDHAHPEYSTPECHSPIAATIAEFAGDAIMTEAAVLATQALQTRWPGSAVHVFKSNSDGKGNSWGAHENYLLPRSLPWHYITQVMLPFFVTRQIYTGTGKVGVENKRGNVPYQVSQRADFFTQQQSLSTMANRGIINTRDEPLADGRKYRRLHVIVGDANRSPYALWLKLGTTALTLIAATRGSMGGKTPWIELQDPVSGIIQVSHDTNLTTTLPIVSGRGMTATEIQIQYFQNVRETILQDGGPDWAEDILAAWEYTLAALENNPMSLADRIDWITKYRVLEDSGTSLDSSRAKAIGQIYHQLGPSGIGTRILADYSYKLPPGFTQEAIELAQTTPPETRAAIRGAAIEAGPEAWSSMDWDHGKLVNGSTVLFPLIDVHENL